MNPTIKAMWVEALRSGTYQQSTGSLRNGDQYCCLGVLCDLHRQVHREHDWQPYHEDNGWPIMFFYLHKSSTTMLPAQVVLWAGLDSVCPKVIYEGIGGQALSSLNDNGISFDDIATAIEISL